MVVNHSTSVMISSWDYLPEPHLGPQICSIPLCHTQCYARSVFQFQKPPILAFLCLTSPNSLHLSYILVKQVYLPSSNFLPPSVGTMDMLILSLPIQFCLYFHLQESLLSFRPQLKYHCWQESFTDLSNLRWGVLLLNFLKHFLSLSLMTPVTLGFVLCIYCIFVLVSLLSSSPLEI